MGVVVTSLRRIAIAHHPGRHHFLAVPLLATPAAPSGVDNAGPATTTSFVIVHGH